MVGTAHHLEMREAGDSAIGIVLRAAGDVAVGVGAQLADADGVETILAFVGEEFLDVLHRLRPHADLRPRISAAAESTALMIGSYPVQRQMLPEIASTTSSRFGFGFSASSARAAMIMPGVQKPHWAAKPVANACCSACISVPVEMPS